MRSVSIKKENVPAPSMLRRLKKLGIDKTDPNDLTSEERSRFSRLDIDPDKVLPGDVLWIPMIAFLREITIGKGPEEKVCFAIPVSISRLPARLWRFWRLPQDLADMSERFSRVVIGTNRKGAITAGDRCGWR